MLSKKPQLSIVVISSCGNTVLLLSPKPAEVIIVDIIPCTISNIASIKSNPYTTIMYAIAKRKNNLNACSGFLISANELQVFITPIRKNITINASPYCLQSTVNIDNYFPNTSTFKVFWCLCY